eukprot:Ihof_evm3s657 gene=Ihof_evmTU3s657
MFGLIIAGRLVQATPQLVDTNKFIFDVTSPETVSHAVVFMTGETPFPEGLGGAVYLNWNNVWQFLGIVSNEKPSAIFHISSAKPKDEYIVSSPFGGVSVLAAPPVGVAQIGISVEPLQELLQMTPAGKDIATVNFSTISQRLLNNLWNYLSSFSELP